MGLHWLSAGSGLLADAELEEIGEVIMKGKAWNITRPSALGIFLLLLVLSLAAGPLAAQSRADCREDASVFTPAWDADAATGTTFTMTKDCGTFVDTVNIRPLEVPNGKTFTIDGGGFTIYAAEKSKYDDGGTAFSFESSSNISLTLRNITIEGGGDAASPTGGDPDPAILVKNGTLILDGVTIQNTRGGAIRVTGTGKVTFKNSTFTGNQVTGATEATVIKIPKGDNLVVEGLLTMKNNVGGWSAIYPLADGRFDIYDAGCIDVAGNLDSDGAEYSWAIPSGQDIAPGFSDLWSGKLKTESNACTANTASTTPRPTATPEPAAGGGDGGGTSGAGMAMPSLAADGRISGMIGSASAHFLINRGGVLVLRIYRVDSDSVGHWVMDVSQTAVDAVSGAGCVASSPDGRYAVRVWADGNVTVSDGPDMENKVLHNTLKGGLTPVIISTETTYSSTPPGVGCPGYIG